MTGDTEGHQVTTAQRGLGRQGTLLRNVADVPVAPMLNPAAAGLDGPRAQVFEAEDGAQQRRLARPAGSENRDELAGFDVEVEPGPQFPLATAQRRSADAERRLGVRGRAGAHASSASASSAMFCCIHEM